MSAVALLQREDIPGPRAATALFRVGLLGCGVVGSSVAKVLLEAGPEITAATGAKLELERVAVKHREKKRPVTLPPGALCTNPFAVVDDPSIDLVVEVVGGVDLPKRLVARAIQNGKSVVTANKELLALHGCDLAVASDDAGVDLLFEGAVGGAIPILAALRDRVRAEETHRLGGVVNGTSNLVLELMAEELLSQEEAVAEAERRGYAEADPTADLDGSDAGAKLAILASLAFGEWATVRSVDRRGITDVRTEDLLCARALGYAVKLLAAAERADDGPKLRVTPALVPHGSNLAGLRGVMNEVTLECSTAGPLTFRGRGAGGDATASAVIGDVVTATRNLLAGSRSPLVTRAATAPLAPFHDDTELSFLRVETDSSAPDAARLSAAIEEAGIDVKAHASASAGGETHTGVIFGPTTQARAEQVRQKLHVRGLRPGTLLPIAEVL